MYVSLCKYLCAACMCFECVCICECVSLFVCMRAVYVSVLTFTSVCAYVGVFV